MESVVSKIIQLDVEISGLREELWRITEKCTPGRVVNFTERQRQFNLEREIIQKRTVLNYILQGSLRPFYFNVLPLEMLAEIFGHVEDPQDKLILLQTFPVIDQLMHWNEIELQFHLAYPLVHPLICHDWRNSFNLCQVSPSFQHTVLEYFERGTQEASRDLHSPWCPMRNLIKIYNFSHEQDDLAEAVQEVETKDYLECPWMVNMPFLFGVSFTGAIPNGVPQNLHQIRTFLEVYGARLWASEFLFLLRRIFPGDDDDEEDDVDEGQLFQDAVATIHGFLEMTPNLRFLNLWGMNLLNLGINFQFPRHLFNLPHLKTFTVDISSSLAQSINVNLPSLECCQLFRSESVPLSFQNFYWACPLKLISLVMDWRNAVPVPDLLFLLNHYNETLEKLNVVYLHIMHQESQLMIDHPEWIIGINLPRLNYLRLDGYFGKLDFLLVLPALESLLLADCIPTAHPPNFLLIPWTKATRFDTNIWYHLLKLKYIHVSNAGQNEWFSVRRREHQDYLEQSHSFPYNLLQYLPFYN